MYKTAKELNFSIINSEDSFKQLTEKEKLYAYWMYKASWAGSPVTARQVSHESYDIIKLFVNTFSVTSPRKFKEKCLKLGYIEEDINDLINYVALIFANNGNYRSYGDTKIIPRLNRAVFSSIMKNVTSRYNEYVKLEDKIYSLKDNEKLLGYPPLNTSSYYSKNVTKEEVEIIDNYLVHKNIEGWNTRLVKNGDLFIITIPCAKIDPKKHISVIENFNGLNIMINYKDCCNEMNKIVYCLEQALKYTANDKQTEMLKSYIKHFSYGNLDDHKQAQIHWVKDKSPTIETNMGFIETYRDPSGVRAEFESFVAIVNKDKSKKLKLLVDNAEDLLKTLPWSKDFEKDKFSAPDFTALDVITFVGSGIPAGINIPNYDDIRQNIGFKNVSLDNIINSDKGSNEKIPYLNNIDNELYKKFVKKSFTIDVAGHELLGHGSGKLFYENDGKFNFDTELINPLTNKKIDSWYKKGETWSSKFGKMGTSYEECRAECVGLYLSCDKKMHNIFNSGDDWENIMYISWLWMIRAGICSMEAYNPTTKEWGQAHSRARYVIYNKLLEVNDFIEINVSDEDFIISIDKSKILTTALDKLKELLLQLHIYKSTADIVRGKNLYDKYSYPSNKDLKLREIIMDNKKPRVEYVQPTLRLTGGSVEYDNYEPTSYDMIKSYITNYMF